MHLSIGALRFDKEQTSCYYSYMTTLHDIFDVPEFLRLRADGYIRTQTHPTKPLMIANYAEKSVYEKVWTPETLASRGLVYREDSLEVLARPFTKFYNVGEHDINSLDMTAPVEVTDKMDGSLGVYILDGEDQMIATRGSFSSDQALWATTWLHNFGGYLPPEGVTPLFEIIYESNRIVLSYPYEGLVLLGGVSIDSGEIFGPYDSVFDSWNGRRTEVFTYNTLFDALAAPPRDREGLVVRYLHPSNSIAQVKIKESSYIELHRIVTGLSEKSVWAMLGEGKTAEQIKENVPDELFDWVDETARNLMDQAQSILDQASEDFHTAIHLTLRDVYTTLDMESLPRTIVSMNRGAFARHAANFPESHPFLFKMLDGTGHDVLWSMAWKRVKPVGDTRVWNRSANNDD